MTLQRYTDYKDSGVEWLGEVPAHWELCRIGTLFREVIEDGSEDLPILSVSIHDGVSDRELSDQEVDRKVTRSEDSSKYKKVMPGDLVYNMMRAWQGGFGAVTTTGMVSPAYVVARPLRKLSTRFVELLLRTSSAVEEMRRHSQGVTDFRLRLYWQDFKTLIVALPSVREQSGIISFLDRETAKIDALVEEQERLIELLAEKRQAFISHAVTKGLDPVAPMKDSGIEWLGEIPAHWNLKRFKDVCDEIVDCKNRTPDKHDDGEYFVVRTSCVRNGKFDPTPGYYTDAASFEEWTKKGRPTAGDILFTREAPAGEACLAPEGTNFCLGQRMMYLRPKKGKFSPDFLLYAIYGPTVRNYIEERSKGSTVGHLRVGEVGELPILTPSREEQIEIVKDLAQLESKLEMLAAEAQRAVNLLKERRAALISSAVTGKIDVRTAAQEQAA